MQGKSKTLTCTRGDEFTISANEAGTVFGINIKDRSTDKIVKVQMFFPAHLVIGMADFILQAVNREELIVYGFNQIIERKGKKK